MLSPEEPTDDGTATPGETAPRRRRAAPTAIVVLAALLVASVVVGAVLVTRLQERNDQWQASSTRWEALAREAGKQAAAARSELAQREADLAGVTKQLSTATKRITALADEKAELADKDASRQQLIDYQSRVQQAASDVTAALGRCIDGQDQLIAYLEDESAYDADDLARYRRGVTTLCGAATDANDALQRALDAG